MNVWVSVTSFTGTILADDRFPSCCLGCPHTLSTCKKGRERKTGCEWRNGFTAPQKSACSSQSVFSARDIVWVRERIGRILPSRSWKQMPCKRRTKLQGRAKNTRKGCSITQIQQSWICQWLPGLQHTWKQAEAVTDKVLANQTSI